MSTPDVPIKGSLERVGFIGLGQMGSAMAARLLGAGYDVTVWSRSDEHVRALVAKGATRAHSRADVIATGHVFSMLANEDVLRAVFTDELLTTAPVGLIHVNHATISARAADEFTNAAAARGQHYVAAPVIGRPQVAESGGLTILAAGDPYAVDTSTPMLESMSRRVWRVGSAASAANLAKISVNYLIIHALQALSESIGLLERHGLDTHKFVEMINDSIFPGPIYGGYGNSIARSTYSPAGFTSVLGLKDLNLAISAAEDAGFSLPTAPVLLDVFQSTVSEIGAELDWSAIAEISRRRSTGGTSPALSRPEPAPA